MNDEPKNPVEDVFDPGFEDDMEVEPIEDFGAEDWDENFDEEATDAEPTPVKRRGGLFSSTLFLIIIAVFVLGGGAFLFLGGDDTTAPNTDSALPPASEEPIQVDELAGSGEMPPMPAPMNTEEPDAPDVALAGDSSLEVPQIPAIPADRKLSEVDVTPPATAPEPTPDPVAEAAPTPVVATPDSALPVPLADNSAELLAAKEKEMADKIAALEKSWQERFSAMEADLKEKVTAAEAKSKAASSETGKNDTALENLKAENQTLKDQLKALAAEKQVAENEAKAAKEQAAKAVSAPAAPLQKAQDLWVLRSAQPDKALISQKGSSVMQSIKVGDNVPGLGTIISVKNEGGNWVVTGSEGRLTP